MTNPDSSDLVASSGDDGSREERARVASMLDRAWKAAGVTPKCELCEHPKWELLSVGRNTRPGLWMADINGPSLDHPISLYYGVACQKCGNVRLFDLKKIEALGKDV